MSLAIIKTGGKQYLVKAGDKIKVEKLLGEVGEIVRFDAFLVTDEEGIKVEIGQPVLADKVTAKILKHGQADKVMVDKYKSKTRYHRHVGHRQPFTLVQIEKI